MMDWTPSLVGAWAAYSGGFYYLLCILATSWVCLLWSLPAQVTIPLAHLGQTSHGPGDEQERNGLCFRDLLPSPPCPIIGILSPSTERQLPLGWGPTGRHAALLHKTAG